jgi:hypothetical protein
MRESSHEVPPVSRVRRGIVLKSASARRALAPIDKPGAGSEVQPGMNGVCCMMFVVGGGPLVMLSSRHVKVLEGTMSEWRQDGLVLAFRVSTRASSSPDAARPTVVRLVEVNCVDEP